MIEPGIGVRVAATVGVKVGKGVVVGGAVVAVGGTLVAVAVAAVAGVPSKTLFTTEMGSRLPFASTPNTVHSTVV